MDEKMGRADFLRQPDVLEARAAGVLRHLTGCAKRINALRTAVERADDGDKQPLREVLSNELAYLENDLGLEIPFPADNDGGDGMVPSAEEIEDDDL